MLSSLSLLCRFSFLQPKTSQSSTDRRTFYIFHPYKMHKAYSPNWQTHNPFVFDAPRKGGAPTIPSMWNTWPAFNSHNWKWILLNWYDETHIQIRYLLANRFADSYSIRFLDGEAGTIRGRCLIRRFDEAAHLLKSLLLSMPFSWWNHINSICWGSF